MLNAQLTVLKGFRRTLYTLRIVNCEVLYVQLNWQVRVKLDGIAFGQQDRVGRKGIALSLSKGMVDLPQCLAEAAGVLVGHVGPEGASQQVTGVEPVAVGDQVGKERPCRHAGDRRQ